jgi:hypothetical protein
MSFLDKLFCKHEWITHAKRRYEWEENLMAKGTEYWAAPKWEKIVYSSTTEVLICKTCGKIKKIEY